MILRRPSVMLQNPLREIPWYCKFNNEQLPWQPKVFLSCLCNAANPNSYIHKMQPRGPRLLQTTPRGPAVLQSPRGRCDDAAYSSKRRCNALYSRKRTSKSGLTLLRELQSLQEERWRCKFFDEVLICKFLRVANPKFLKGKKTRSMLPKMSSWRKQTDLARLPSQAHRYVADPHHNTATNHTKKSKQ